LLYWEQPEGSTYREQLLRFLIQAQLPAIDQALWPLLDAYTYQPEPFVAGLIGTLLLQLQDLTLAERWLLHAHAAQPDDPAMLYNLARLRLAQGDTLAAQPYFQQFQATQR
ncbi:hypothetical protein RZS08_40825, partial [Arthrospira platensis SPKY1]|nr:hypothetical protein [Arthrospira platensis SPKY1]